MTLEARWRDQLRLVRLTSKKYSQPSESFLILGPPRLRLRGLFANNSDRMVLLALTASQTLTPYTKIKAGF